MTQHAARVLLALSAVAFGAPASALAPGFGTVDADGPGGNPAITYEQVRFYTPSLAQFPTSSGSAAPVDLCSGADICGESLAFNTTFGGALLATAWAGYGASKGIVYQDLTPQYGGLGVAEFGTDRCDPAAVTGGDQIDKGDLLKLSFGHQVTVVGFHFFEGDHSRTDAGDYGYLRVDGLAWQKLSLFPNYVTNDPGRWYTGSVFEFKKGNQDYYLGAIKIVPEPQVLVLMLVGLGVLGLRLGRRGHGSLNRAPGLRPG